ncbi:MAG: class II histone deacetylase [Pseudomonadota bacterium]
MTTGLLWHELYMWHDTGRYAGIMAPDPALGVEPHLHNENTDTKRRIKNLLDATGYSKNLTPVEPREITQDEMLAVHTPAYLKTLEALNETGGSPAMATHMGRGSYDIARLSAGGCIAMMEAILAGQIDNGYALCRPPGHHAEAGQSMGFCFLANAALTAKAAQARGLEKVAIIDWDVHHGNGTQSAFYDDPSVLTISLHQDNCFPPESGPKEERGSGAGEGFNINIPLPPGSGRGAYLYAFDQLVIPALDHFAPDFVIVASGFDSMGQDPLGRNMLYGEIYKQMAQQLMAVADRHAKGRIMMTHEGGYNPHSVPFAALKVFEALTGIDAPIDDPYEPLIAMMGGQDLMKHQQELIDELAAM